MGLLYKVMNILIKMECRGSQAHTHTYKLISRKLVSK